MIIIHLCNKHKTLELFFTEIYIFDNVDLKQLLFVIPFDLHSQ